MAAVPFVCVFAFLVAAVQGQCRDGWVYDGDRGSCYAIPNGAEGNWAEAMGYCAAMSSELAVIESQEEQQFLMNLLNSSTGFYHDKDFWVGAVDILEEGVFIWANRMTQVERFFWGPGEPSDQAGTTSGQGCLRLEHEYNYLWGDGDCLSSEYFVCEREPEGR